MQTSDLTLKKLLVNNLRLLSGTFFLIFSIAYAVVVLRSWSYFFIPKFQLVATLIATSIGILYLGVATVQLYLDNKRKRKSFFRAPLLSLPEKGYALGFSKLSEWNYASSWCLQQDFPNVYCELDVDRVTGEQKNFVHFRIKPAPYNRKAFQQNSRLATLDGEADRKCLVFFIEDALMKSMSSEEADQWLLDRIQFAETGGSI